MRAVFGSVLTGLINAASWTVCGPPRQLTSAPSARQHRQHRPQTETAQCTESCSCRDIERDRKQDRRRREENERDRRGVGTELETGQVAGQKRQRRVAPAPGHLNHLTPTQRPRQGLRHSETQRLRHRETQRLRQGLQIIRQILPASGSS